MSSWHLASCKIMCSCYPINSIAGNGILASRWENLMEDDRKKLGKLAKTRINLNIILNSLQRLNSLNQTSGLHGCGHFKESDTINKHNYTFASYYIIQINKYTYYVIIPKSTRWQAFPVNMVPQQLTLLGLLTANLESTFWSAKT